MQFGQIINRPAQDFAVVYLRTKHDLRVNFNSGVQHLLHFRADVRALLVDSEEISPHLKIRSVYRHVLRREPLFDHAPHLVFGN